jgi:hypothetical protein
MSTSLSMSALLDMIDDNNGILFLIAAADKEFSFTYERCDFWEHEV